MPDVIPPDLRTKAITLAAVGDSFSVAVLSLLAELERLNGVEKTLTRLQDEYDVTAGELEREKRAREVLSTATSKALYELDDCGEGPDYNLATNILQNAQREVVKILSGG